MLDKMIMATDIILNLYLYLAGFLVFLMLLDCAVKVYGLFTYSFLNEPIIEQMVTEMSANSEHFLSSQSELVMQSHRKTVYQFAESS
jgi:hypothetical protein